MVWICLFQTKVDRVQGADPTSLENKIQQYYGSEDPEDGDSSFQGHVRSCKSILFVLYTYITLQYLILKYFYVQ